MIGSDPGAVPANDSASRARVVLFVAGDAPRSARARSNIDGALVAIGDAALEVEVVDVLREPGRTLEHGVFATPALTCTGNATSHVLYGDLSDTRALHDFLRHCARAHAG